MIKILYLINLIVKNMNEKIKKLNNSKKRETLLKYYSKINRVY